MRITIAERLKPFSHTPGINFILPGTTLRFQLFPALLRIHDLSEAPALLTEISMGIEGPVQDFTVLQDLEKGEIKVWGKSLNGYFRYSITPIDRPPRFMITIEKQPQQKEIILPHYSQTTERLLLQQQERLSLGNHKAQDWDKIRQRGEMTEIFPLWLRLGQISPTSQNCITSGTTALLDPCREAIEQRDIVNITSAFKNLFLAGFDTGLSPRLLDEQYQGFSLTTPSNVEKISPIILLTEGASLIRRIFFYEENEGIHILPALPPEFHCGRFLQLRTSAGLLDIEWSKKTIRRMIFKASHNADLFFLFQKGLKQFRLRQKESERGSFISSNTPISFIKDKTYLFDRFL